MKVIIALDLEKDQALELIERINREITQPELRERIYFKVGMYLYYAHGNAMINFIKERGFKVFLDLKLNDIPNTMYDATKTLLQQNIDILSVHTFAGAKGLAACVQAKRDLGNTQCELFGISVLTSMTQEDLTEDLQVPHTIEECVDHRVQIAKQAGLDGIVSSPLEAHITHKHGLKALTPGIRFKNNDAHDQSRITTPKFALDNNIDYIVAGRIITGSADPVKSLVQCLAGAEYDE